MNTNYAGFWRRLGAVVLDALIIGAVNGILGLAVNLIVGGSNPVLNTVTGFALTVAYYVFYQASATQTLGKKVLGIKVITEQGATPSVMTFFLREVIGKAISAIILFIGYLMMLWDGKNQTLHDKIASTVVVRV